MRNFSTREILTFDIATAWLATMVLFGWFTNGWWQLGSMLASLVFLLAVFVNFALMFSRWQKERAAAAIPLFICFMAVVVLVCAAPKIRQFQFELNRPAYEKVVSGIESGNILIADKPFYGETALDAGNAKYVLARKTDGGLEVEFLTGFGFPVKHSGYLYVESGELKPGSFFEERWPKRSRVDAHWYRIAD